jgi:hypothetical protein
MCLLTKIGLLQGLQLYRVSTGGTVMPDKCNACGRSYVYYRDGHRPNSEECLTNQIKDMKKQLETLKDEIESLKRNKA